MATEGWKGGEQSPPPVSDRKWLGDTLRRITSYVLLVMLRLLIPIVILVLLLEWLMGGSPSLDIWIEWILVVLIIGTALLLVQPITAPIVRYSLRMAPLPLGESARSSSVLGLALAWLIVFLILWTAEWPVRAIVVLVGVLGIWKSWEIRRRWKGEPDGEIVLFLRRFDKSADRTIGTAVRQVVPENKQLVFLMGNRPGGASWDPFLVGFDGLHLGWDPKSLPLYLQTTDEEWVERVRGTLQRAKAVIFDATDWSGPMETEASLIEETNAGEKTLVVMRGDRNADAPPIPRKRMIRYRRTWRGTFQRIFWGGVIIVFLPQILMTETQTEEGPNPIATIMLSIVWFWICVRRLMDKDSVEELRKELAVICLEGEQHPSN